VRRRSFHAPSTYRQWKIWDDDENNQATPVPGGGAADSPGGMRREPREPVRVSGRLCAQSVRAGQLCLVSEGGRARREERHCLAEIERAGPSGVGARSRRGPPVRIDNPVVRCIRWLITRGFPAGF
jgi:hypothetical protein